MSDVPFPSLPGLKMRVTRTLLNPVTRQTTQNGQELRVKRWSGPKFRYRLEFEFLRKNNVATDEVTTLVNHINGHGGSFDSFPFTDPMDGVIRRVRYDADEIEFEQVAKGIWAVGELELVTTSVNYQTTGGGNLTNAAAGVILPATDDSTTWLMTVDDAGDLTTGRLAAVAGGQIPANLILLDSSAGRWKVTVLGQENGRLVTTADGSTDPTTALTLASANGTAWIVAPDTHGTLGTTEAT